MASVELFSPNQQFLIKVFKHQIKGFGPYKFFQSHIVF